MADIRRLLEGALAGAEEATDLLLLAAIRGNEEARVGLTEVQKARGGEMFRGANMNDGVNGDSYPNTVVEVRRNGREVDVVCSRWAKIDGKVVWVPDMHERKTVTLRKNGRYFTKGQPMTWYGGYRLGPPISAYNREV